MFSLLNVFQTSVCVAAGLILVALLTPGAASVPTPARPTIGMGATTSCPRQPCQIQVPEHAGADPTIQRHFKAVDAGMPAASTLEYGSDSEAVAIPNDNGAAKRSGARLVMAPLLALTGIVLVLFGLALIRVRRSGREGFSGALHLLTGTMILMVALVSSAG